MRDQTRIVVEVDDNGHINCVYTNDPQLQPIKVEIVKTGMMEECGSCDHYHLHQFAGDCRDDNERFVTLDA